MPLNGMARLSPVAALAMAFIIQVVAVSVFIARLDAEVSRQREQMILIASDIRTLHDRVEHMRDEQAGHTFKIEDINRNIKRIEDRIDRVVSAMDSMYSQLVEHLKNNHKQQ